MNRVGTFPRISTDETLRETVRHGSAAYPFQYYLEDVWEFDFHSVDWHWHPEVELLSVTSGLVRCFAGGGEFAIGPGCGAFINSRVVHRFTAGASAVMPNAVFLPTLLAPQDSLIYQQYVQPVLAQLPPCTVLRPDVPWQGQILQQMADIAAMHEAGQADEWRIFRRLTEIWDLLLQHADRQPVREEKADTDVPQARLQIMLQFIHDHYQQPLTLRDIADAVYISKNSALQIFHNGIRMAPVAYLIQHRLKCAARLLKTTEKSVTAIAEETGFASAGYFCRKFRALYGMSPLAYRRSKQP